jgi:hypothetical protein
MKTGTGRFRAFVLLIALLASVRSHAADCIFVPAKSICGVSLRATRREFVATLGTSDGELRMGAHRLGYFYGQRLLLIFSRDRLVEAHAWETNPNIDFWHEVSNGSGRDSLCLVFPGWNPWGVTRKEFKKQHSRHLS